MPTDDNLEQFKEEVWKYYRTHGRHDLPWRVPFKGVFDPYQIMVSEVMLQQTQVGRVISKFQAFIQQFPTVQQLAHASLSEVLIAWSGLGYNRRAKFLWQAAKMITNEQKGNFPKTLNELSKLPGIGINTASAILAYAFGISTSFIETNIRTVYIHHFFSDAALVSDAELMPIITATLDNEHPRIWYWALMDYGSHLKQVVGNASRNSRSYTKQSKFEGSLRQIRGQVIRKLSQGPITDTQLVKYISDPRLELVLAQLLQEKLIEKTNRHYHLP